ncbi:MAG: site-2 protease family protein [Chloroflexi bacterium]|nr:MAG: site-2 protease family protein [Chloroflexota bacterium]
MFQILSLFQISPTELFAIFAAFVVAVTAHQFGHAIVAHRAGDPEPRLQRKLSLNPLAHLHWVGMFMFAFLGFGIFNSAPVSHYRVLDDEEPQHKDNDAEHSENGEQSDEDIARSEREAKRKAEEQILRENMPELFVDDASVAAAEWHGYAERQDFYAALLAGPLINLVLGIIFTMILRQQELNPGFTAALLNNLIAINFIFFFLSFVPLPPMDGWLALLSFLPRERAMKLKEHEMNLCYLLAGLIILDFVINSNIFGLPVELRVVDYVIGSPARILQSTFMGR